MLGELIFQLVVILASVGSILLVITLFYFISKKRYKKPGVLPFCPKCASTALHYLKKEPGESYFVGSLHANNAFECVSCGFQGLCPQGTLKEIEEYKKNL